jgi:hypothetical protein
MDLPQNITCLGGLKFAHRIDRKGVNEFPSFDQSGYSNSSEHPRTVEKKYEGLRSPTIWD